MAFTACGKLYDINTDSVKWARHWNWGEKRTNWFPRMHIPNWPVTTSQYHSSYLATDNALPTDCAFFHTSNVLQTGHCGLI